MPKLVSFNTYTTPGKYMLLRDSVYEYKWIQILQTGPAIELHVLTAASRPRYCILNIIYHKRKRKKMNLPIFTEIIKWGRNVQLIPELRLSPSTNLARKSSSHNICNEALLIAALERCQLCSKQKSFQWLFWESLNNFAVIMAAYSRILLGAKNQSGTGKVCLLSANRGLFPVQWNII